MNNLIAEVSQLTTIPEKSLVKILQKITYCICQDIKEATLADQEICEIDTGIGVLYIKVSDPSDPKYKFIPSDNLRKAVANTAQNKLNLLEDVLNDSLAKTFMNVYKDLC